MTAEHKIVHSCSHEALEGLVRSAHDRLATNVERGIDNDGAPRLAIELSDQVIEERMVLAGHRLETRGPVHAIVARTNQNVLSFWRFKCVFTSHRLLPRCSAEAIPRAP